MKLNRNIAPYLILSLIFVLSPFLITNIPTSGHSTIAYPTEIFSIWNNTAPSINGQINFAHDDIDQEWTSAAVSNLYNSSDQVAGKLFIQNNNVNLYIGLDVLNLQTESPVTDWGSSIFFDIDHNGKLSSVDRLIRFTDNSSGQFVEFLSYSTYLSDWSALESGSLDIPLASSGILVSTSFGVSDFGPTKSHRQYEFKIPFTSISCLPGDVLGISFEATDNYGNSNAGIIWPYISGNQDLIRSNVFTWGDIQFGESSKTSFDYVVEENFNIKSSAIGYNNGTFLTTADIDGNSDLELVVSSNRTVLGDNYLMAIYDYRSGDYQRIWASWETSHQSKLTTVIAGIAAYDFTGDGKDELYAVGTSNTILRFSEWNATASDFEVSETVFTHTSAFMGYLAIGDGDDDGFVNLVAGDQNGGVIVLDYNDVSDTFAHDARSPFNPTGSFRIHAVSTADMDSDLHEELIFSQQITADNAVSLTRFMAYRRLPPKFADNPDDDLPIDSTVTTEDNFGHTIIVEDLNMDNINDIIIAGKDYLKIFNTSYSFTNPTPSLELIINDNTSEPSMGGGAAVADINQDGRNELIFSANNGTIYVGCITDSGSSFDFHLNWSGDFGTSFGKRNSILIFDIDSDGENEIILGDTMGQILVLGKGDPPSIIIDSPSPGFVSSSESITAIWTITTDFISVHHTDIYIDTIFQKRVGGSITSSDVFLTPGQNNIEIVTYSYSGQSDSANVTVEYDVKAPQVTIISPPNNFKTDLSYVQVTYNNSDPDDDFDYYRIYRNETEITDYTEEETYSITLPSDGTWNITIVAVDETLLEGKSSIYVIRDTTPPIISITSPLDGAAVKVSNLDIYWTASDIHTSVDYSEVFVDSISQGTTSSNTFNIDLLSDKDYLIEVVTYDVLGNFASDSITITRDTVNPIISVDPIALPQLGDGTYYTNIQILFVSWNAIDNILGTGIDNIQLTINGLLYDTYNPLVTSDFVNLGNESHKEIALTAFDKAGNTHTAEISIIFDQTTPNLTIDHPPDNYQTGLDYFIVSWESFDLGVGLKEFRIYTNGTQLDIIIDISTLSYLIPILENETLIVTVRAIDYLNYFNDQSITVRQNSSAPTIIIVDPSNMFTYSNTTIFDISWDVSGMDVDYFEIYVNNSLYNSYTNTTFTAAIDLGIIPIDEYPLYNITIRAVTTDLKIYEDIRWITIDQTPPVISFILPTNNSVVLNSNLHIEWFSNDVGSDLYSFRIQIEGITVSRDANPPFDNILDITGFDGYYELFIFGYDKAGNKGNTSIIIFVSLSPPSFYTSLETTEYRNSGNFQFNLTINDPGLGVKSISIIADNTNTVYSEDFGTDYVYTPIWRLINTLDADFLAGIDYHNLTMSILDKASRESRETSFIIIDTVAPVFFQAPIIDYNVLNTVPRDIIHYDDIGINNHSISAYIIDTYGIAAVEVHLIGPGYDQTFDMVFNSEDSQGTLYQFDVIISFDSLTHGLYEINFTYTDLASNTNTNTYYFNLVDVPVVSDFPLIPVVVGLGVFLILSIVMVVSLRKPIKNRGWHEEIQNITYILKSGLTVLYVPYSSQMITDEQLFGGAMSGIRGILEEIIGKQSKFDVETVEFGKKHLLIYTSSYGDAVLVVNNVKPNHSQKLKLFTNEFEFIYRDAVSDDTHVDMSRFKGSIDLVKKYFGEPEISKGLLTQKAIPLRRRSKLARRMKDDPAIEKEILVTSLHKKLSLEETSLEHISRQTKIFIGDSIILAEKALISLIDYDYKEADKHAKAALRSLDVALQSQDDLEIFQSVINAIPKIVEEVFNGISSGERNDTINLYTSIENVSKLFLECVSDFSV
ncbi:MAG: hypothetical protein KAX09_05785 [Candidatus Heimdallarchaeota archaeon]|nr:hypothetical protein [Candidatus Heimdallarchaeota archaeon]MCK4290477.1 hypothetical protein [Candidatus Heimdallarchaeota archaeon]